MLRQFLWLSGLVLASALMLPQSTYAADAVGRIISLEGTPKVERSSGGLIEIRRDDPVHIGDVVRTYDGRAKILFQDNSIMTLGQETELKITSFLFEPKQEKRTSMFDLLSGKVKTLVGKLFSSAPDFKVRTPTAVAGVRGTYFQVGFDGDTDVTVFDGEVDVQNSTGDILQLVSGGQLTINSSGFVGGVVQLTPAQLANKQNEVAIRLEEMLNSEADKNVDRRGLAQRAVDSLGGVPGPGATGGSDGFNTIDNDGGDVPNPLGSLESVDPARGGNVNLQLQFPAEQ